jgi:hypothetical protein
MWRKNLPLLALLLLSFSVMINKKEQKKALIPSVLCKKGTVAPPWVLLSH